MNSSDYLEIHFGGAGGQPHGPAVRILLPWAEIESMSPAVEAQSPNHWTTIEIYSPGAQIQ